MGSWERQTDKRRKKCKRERRGKRGKKRKEEQEAREMRDGEGKLCLAGAFKGCTWRVADGRKAPGDDVAALETEAGCCGRNGQYLKIL